MKRVVSRSATLFLLLATTACSQPAAKVDLRGQNIYGRNSTISNDDNRNNQSYASYSAPKNNSNYKPYKPAPVYANTKQTPSRIVPQETSNTASLQSIGVSDLQPPSASAASNIAAPKSSNINRWSNKPREEEKEESQIISHPEHKPVKLIAYSPKSFMWPVGSHKVISPYGPKGAGKTNDGINIASPEGEPVWAAADGEISYAGNELSGYGNMLLIKHAGGKSTSYAHLSRATVDKYDRVKQGDIIGYVGSTGGVKKPQLHFAIRDGKDPVDPKKYLSTNMAGL